MRIVSGQYGGRRIQVPRGQSIRPTSDKVRGAIFNILGSRNVVADAVVMDVFCGTGALGLEALSRGARFCIFIDQNRESLEISRKNVHALGADRESRLILKDATRTGARPEALESASLVFLDPPYHKNLLQPSLESLVSGGWLAPDAMIVCESEKSYTAGFPEKFVLEDERVYKDTKVSFLSGRT